MLTAGPIALLAVCGFGAAAVAQDAAGGVRLTFGIDLRMESDSNADLDPTSAGRSSRATAGLGFSLASETRSSRIALDMGAVLQAEDAPGTGNNGLINPHVALAYRRDSADASFTLDAVVRETDLTRDRDVTDFDTNSGTRRTSRIDTGLSWGEGRPLGFGLTAGFTDIAYKDAPGEADSSTARLGATLRMDLSKVTRLDLGLRGSRFDEDGAAETRDTLGFDAGVSIARPRGGLGVDLSVDDTEDGQRESLKLWQSIELPRGSLAYSLGVSVGVDDKTRLIGSLDYAIALPNGSLVAALDRSVRADREDAESLVTSASLSYLRDLGPLSHLSLSLNWAESEATATGLTTSNSSFGATYSHDLTEDWAWDMGYRHRLRDEDGEGRGRSDTVFVGLRREFTALR